jgi:asparagine synthase (glutamine-hydrolysing)
MQVFPKRRFQHGAVPVEVLHGKMPYREADYRNRFLALYS